MDSSAGALLLLLAPRASSKRLLHHPSKALGTRKNGDDEMVHMSFMTCDRVSLQKNDQQGSDAEQSRRTVLLF